MKLVYNGFNLLALYVTGELLLIAKTPAKPKAKREKSTTTKGHYVTNGVLLPAVIEAKGLGKVTDKLIRMIQMIAERYSRKSNFIGYSFREDMVSAAVMNLCNNALKFNPEKSSNPFSYYTTGIHNSFLQYMADEKKHRNIRDALLIDAGSNPSFNFMEGEKDEHHFEVKESDEHFMPDTTPQDLGDAELKQLLNPDATVEADGEIVLEPSREVKVRYAARIPGPVTRLKPGEFILDPVTNTYIRVTPPEPEKKVRKPRVMKEPFPFPPEKTTGEKVAAARLAHKNKIINETPVKEKAQKPKVVKEKATPVKKNAKTKAPVKKITGKVEKSPAKKVVEKKSPAKKVTSKKIAAIPETKLKPLARAKKAAEEVKSTKKVPAKKTAVKKAK